ncbi:transcription factor bHLH147-like [Bidens hawaiensis]|uniref:transcription factor bHLH147-like n=1 Tax=Bidens hawaiensis TaxID=980011 RepID=UPI00404B3FB4
MMALNSDPQRRRKKKKIQTQSTDQIIPSWKSEAQQQVYNSKLLQALRHLRLTSTPSTVRETADRVLAVTAKGRTRWSRAILKNKLKIKFRKNNKRQRASAAGNSRIKKPRLNVLRLKAKNLPAVQRKTRVLGRLVPGCRKQPLPVVLEEATDYIAALEMQVKAMAALADILSAASTSQQQPSL